MKDERAINLAAKIKKATELNTFAGSNLELASHVDFGIPTGVPQLDLALQRPGLPAGRIVEVYGKEMSSKTTLTLAVIAQAQQMGGLGVFVDTERSFDEERAVNCGVDIENLILTEPETIEGTIKAVDAALDSVEAATSSSPLVIVVDSITGVNSKGNLERSIDDEPRPGEDARVIKRGLRKLNPKISEKNALVIFINHVFYKMNAMAFAKQTESTGGLALKYMASVRIALAGAGNLLEGKGPDQERLGMITAIEVEKNKVAHNGKPKFKAEVTEDGFDMYSGLWEAFITIGSLERQDTQNYHFSPTGTTLRKKEWVDFVNGEPDKVKGMYNFFLKIAAKNGHLRPYKTT